MNQCANFKACLENQDDKVREAKLACLVLRCQCHKKILDVNDAHLDHQVKMARPDLLVKTDKKARLAIPEVMVCVNIYFNYSHLSVLILGRPGSSGPPGPAGNAGEPGRDGQPGTVLSVVYK